MNKEAARYFRECLFDPKIGREAMAYLTARGLDTATIKRFGLGYSPASFSALTSRLRDLGYSDEELVAGFLCGRSRNNGSLFDYFRNRVMFPIIDVSGNVIAFGGRVMDDSQPKYLNSSDTPVFKKSRNLFALNFARTACSEELILCEGYMDVIALHAAGFTNAVATLGTAITPEQARIMSRYTKKVLISYDIRDLCAVFHQRIWEKLHILKSIMPSWNRILVRRRITQYIILTGICCYATLESEMNSRRQSLSMRRAMENCLLGKFRLLN